MSAPEFALVRDVMRLIHTSRLARRDDGVIVLRGCGPGFEPASAELVAAVEWLDRYGRLTWQGWGSVVAEVWGQAPRLTKTAERLRARWSRCWPDNREKARRASVVAALRTAGITTDAPLGRRR